MADLEAAPAPAEAKPKVYHGLAEAMSALNEQRKNAAPLASPPAAEAPAVAAAEESNPEPGETAEANSVETEEPAPEETVEQPTEGEPEPTEEQDDGQTIVQLKDGSEVPLEELVAGYMKDGDYRKKTQALAEERRTLTAERTAFEGKVKEFETGYRTELSKLTEATQAAQAERDKYAATIAEVEKALNAQGAEFANIDWVAEAQRDPNGWQLKFARFQQWERANEVTRAEKAELEAKRKADAETATRQSQEEAQRAWLGQKNALSAHIEAKHATLVDPEKGKQEWSAMFATGRAAGFPDEVLLAAFGQQYRPDVPIMAPQVFELLRKATLYDRLVAEPAKVLASAKATPKPDADGRIKVVRAAAPRHRPPTATASELGRAQAAFNKSPTQANAMALQAAKRAHQATRTA